MDLKQLEYFVNVVDLGSFSRAGRLLGIAQPAISRQIRSLEVELRQNLLLRNGRGAAPTAAGKRLLEHARGILQQVDRARSSSSSPKAMATRSCRPVRSTAPKRRAGSAYGPSSSRAS